MLRPTPARLRLFRHDADYELLLRVLAQAHERVGMRTIGYCVMPNHWHLVLWPRTDDDLSEFMRWLTVTHTQRWHASHGTAGEGHVYQGRFKSFPVQQTRPPTAARAMGLLQGGDAVLSVLRYVERNPVTAGLVRRAQAWPWSSGHVRLRPRVKGALRLADPPGGLPPDWTAWVNRPQTQAEFDALARCIRRGAPFGRAEWVQRVAREWGLESTLRPRGRPRNQEKGS